ncbi:hypothetical protein PYCC9005_005100 [Savitreella phatthalungensis]
MSKARQDPARAFAWPIRIPMIDASHGEQLHGELVRDGSAGAQRRAHVPQV